MSIHSDLEQLKQRTLDLISQAEDTRQLDEVRIRSLGKKGDLTGFLKQLAAMEPEQKRDFGKVANLVKEQIKNALERRGEILEEAELNKKLERERIDITQPTELLPQGLIHPLSQTIDEAASVFGEMGFSIVEGPEIEDDWHNFTALNMPANHPARQMQDTFYMKGFSGDEGSLLLRTHTSNMQIRVMQEREPPIRILSLGRTYRCDSDATHTPMFNQIEGLVVDTNIHMGHLKGCLLDFLRLYFANDSIRLRLRPSYFPFTEPSVEVDIGCEWSGKQLKIGEGQDWLEILGAGMLHPQVLKNCNINPDKYQGFAFGMGIERICMLKYGISDLRAFFDCDTRWLAHYGFNALDIPTGIGLNQHRET